jgi:HPt (histidine-containing phosphotransfer) domain-containing protein
MNSDSVCWDRSRALDAVGGDEDFLSELAGIFCAACPTLLKSLEDSISAKDLFSAAETAHLLGRAAQNLAAPGVMQAAITVETMARRKETEELRNACYTLRQEASRLVDALQDYRNKRFEMLRKTDPWQS